jgi:hypothetical protein
MAEKISFEIKDLKIFYPSNPLPDKNKYKT